MEENRKKGPEQEAVIAFLSQAETYGIPTRPVTRIDTHISVIFLVGDRAYKMKRALKFPYLDYGTLDRRRQFCETELAVNQRTAPTLYRRVIAVTREPDGQLCLDGEGEPVEWLLEMRRFDQEFLFDRMAMADRLSPALMTTLADEIAAFHQTAEAETKKPGSEILRWVIDGNNQQIAERVPDIFDATKAARLQCRMQEVFGQQTRLLDERAGSGGIRRCHGDLHLRNICLFEDRPTLFDGIEFNDAITVIDVLYDLAFLLMDLEHRGHRDLANIVFNRYMAMSDEMDGLAAMPLFLACRAAVRAHTTAAAAQAQGTTQAEQDLLEEARAYLDLAGEFLVAKPASLIAIGGLSGTGKSTLARLVAPRIGQSPGALLLRSDVIRKRLFGVALEARLGAEAYTSEQSNRVYAHLHRLAVAALSAGYSVVTDAVFARPEEREAIEKVAQYAKVPLRGFWLEAPPQLLQERVSARVHDASDATADIVQQQLTYEIGPHDWHVIDAGQDANATFADVWKIISASC